MSMSTNNELLSNSSKNPKESNRKVTKAATAKSSISAWTSVKPWSVWIWRDRRSSTLCLTPWRISTAWRRWRSSWTIFRRRRSRWSTISSIWRSCARFRFWFPYPGKGIKKGIFDRLLANSPGLQHLHIDCKISVDLLLEVLNNVTTLRCLSLHDPQAMTFTE